MPDWLRFIVLQCLGKIFHKKLRNDDNPLENKIPFEKRRRLRSENGYFESFIPIERQNLKWPLENRSRGASMDKEQLGAFNGHETSSQEFDDKSSQITKAITHKQETIANALEKLVEAKDAEDEEGKQREEWMMAASIMDSLFMWIFFLTLVGSLAALFFQLPKYD